MTTFGATTPTLALTGVTAGMDGNLYRCRATNEYGARFSDSALLTVNAVVGDFLFLPPLTELTNSWYSDCASAASDVSANASNCIGYVEEDHAGTFGSFVATDGGSSLQLNGNGDGSVTPTLTMWGSLNLGNGDVVGVAFSDGMGPFPGFVSTTFSLYDDAGNLVETIGPGASPLAFGPVASAGRYTVKSASVASGFGVTYAACDAVFTSSGSLSVNPIQARYSNGMGGYSSLTCGNSCP